MREQQDAERDQPEVIAQAETQPLAAYQRDHKHDRRRRSESARPPTLPARRRRPGNACAIQAKPQAKTTAAVEREIERRQARRGSAQVAPPWRRAARTRSAGAISICKPRRPPFTRTVGCASAARSMKAGSAFLLAERRNSADVIAGDPLGLGRRQHGGILFAPAPRPERFRLTSLSEGASTQTIVPPAFAIRVFSRRAGGMPSASAACMPMRAAFGS